MIRSILVVDDDPNITHLLAELLTDEGYAVRCARDGQAALDEIRREPPALIVTDVMMPKLDGVSLTRRLRGGRPDPHCADERGLCRGRSARRRVCAEAV